MSDYETHEDDESERFDDPIKINWTGYARSRISEYNGDFDEDDSGDSPMSPERFLKTVGRLKTRVVVITHEEADALRYELGSYDHQHRTWMNSSMGRSLNLVISKLDAAMDERGYQPVFGRHSFRGYYSEAEAEAEQERIDRRFREIDRRREELKKKTGEIYSEVRDLGAKNYWYHGDEAKICFSRDADRDGAEVAARLLREAGCDNVSIEETEHTQRGPMAGEVNTYTTWEVTGDIPESGYGLN